MKGCLISLALIIGGLILIGSILGQTADRATAQRSPDNFDACFYSQKLIAKQLKAPTTAKFPTCREPDAIVAKTNGKWTVRSYVDAQNSFGAMMRADTIAILSYNAASDVWTLDDFSLVTR